MILASIGDQYLTRRLAIAESKRAARLLMADEPRLVVTLGKDQGLAVSLDDGRFHMPFTQFLTASRGIRDRTWKLVNLNLKDGLVSLDRQQAVRLLEAVLTERYPQQLPSQTPQWVHEALAETLTEVRGLLAATKSTFEEFETGDVDSECFPPCIKGIFGMMQRHENVSHMGRFALVSFLNTAGMNKDQIFEFFRKVPDFNVEKSRYQIEHIIGDISGTAYTPPECATMKTHSICLNPDGLCGQPWMTHPLKYYRSKVRRKARDGPAPPRDASAGDAPPTGAAEDAASDQDTTEAATGGQNPAA